jgi:hypothetical protein
MPPHATPSAIGVRKNVFATFAEAMIFPREVFASFRAYFVQDKSNESFHSFHLIQKSLGIGDF